VSGQAALPELPSGWRNGFSWHEKGPSWRSGQFPKPWIASWNTSGFRCPPPAQGQVETPRAVTWPRWRGCLCGPPSRSLSRSVWQNQTRLWQIEV